MSLCKLCGINPTSGGLCSQCTDQWNEDNAVIDWLISEGHTRHCACRFDTSCDKCFLRNVCGTRGIPEAVCDDIKDALNQPEVKPSPNGRGR